MTPCLTELARQEHDCVPGTHKEYCLYLKANDEQVSEEPTSPRAYPTFNCEDRAAAQKLAHRADSLLRKQPAPTHPLANTLIESQLIRYAMPLQGACDSAVLDHNSQQYAATLEAATETVTVTPPPPKVVRERDPVSSCSI
jgi:hypothetical protein